MKIIESFENFTENNKLDKHTLLFLNDNISDKDFFNYLENDSINESLYNIKEKLLNVISTIIIKAKQIGFKIFEKFNSVIRWIIGKLNSFKNKYPRLYSVIRITIIISIILIISISSVYASSTGNPIPIDEIDMAIGLLRELPQNDGLTIFKANSTIAYLVDLRDGKLDLDGIAQESINIANAALKTVTKLKSEAIAQDNHKMMDICMDLMDKGKEVLSAMVEKTDSTTRVTLKYK